MAIRSNIEVIEEIEVSGGELPEGDVVAIAEVGDEEDQDLQIWEIGPDGKLVAKLVNNGKKSRSKTAQSDKSDARRIARVATVIDGGGAPDEHLHGHHHHHGFDPLDRSEWKGHHHNLNPDNDPPIPYKEGENNVPVEVVNAQKTKIDLIPNVPVNTDAPKEENDLYKEILARQSYVVTTVAEREANQLAQEKNIIAQEKPIIEAKSSSNDLSL